MDVSSEGGAAGGLTGIDHVPDDKPDGGLKGSPLSWGRPRPRSSRDMLHEASIGGVVTRSPLIQQRLKNRVASNLSLSHDDSRSRNRCPGRVEVASLKEHVPIFAPKTFP